MKHKSNRDEEGTLCINLEVGDLVWLDWRNSTDYGRTESAFVKQPGVVVDYSARKTRFKLYLSSGETCEVTAMDFEKGDAWLISKIDDLKTKGVNHD